MRERNEWLREHAGRYQQIRQALGAWDNLMVVVRTMAEELTAITHYDPKQDPNGHVASYTIGRAANLSSVVDDFWFLIEYEQKLKDKLRDDQGDEPQDPEKE
jgi:hypothetical protein